MTDIEMTKIEYKLVGPHAGKTIKFNKGKYQFVDGVLSVEVREDQVDKYKGFTRQLARAYNAHPVGSKALAKAEALWAEHTGQTKGVKNAGGQANKAGKAGANGPAADGEGADGAEDGAEGHETEGGDGDGAGDDGGDDESTAALKDALNKLDPKKDKHWTSTGLPNLKILGELLGYGVTRTEIEAAMPGFNRQAAMEAQG